MPWLVLVVELSIWKNKSQVLLYIYKSAKLLSFDCIYNILLFTTSVIKLKNNSLLTILFKKLIKKRQQKTQFVINCFRYTPDKACKIIIACIILHNKAILQRLPPPADDDCNDDCNHDDHDDDHCGDNGSDNEHNAPENLNGRMVRDRITQEYFQRYVH